MVTRLTPRALWIAEGVFPARYCKRIRARSTSRTGATREACRVSSRFCSSAVSTKAGSLDFPATPPTLARQTTSVNVLTKRCTSALKPRVGPEHTRAIDRVGGKNEWAIERQPAEMGVQSRGGGRIKQLGSEKG